MLQNYSKLSKFIKALALSIWVVVGFYMSQIIAVILLRLLIAFGVPVRSLNEAVLNASIAAVIYIVTLILVVGLPWLIKKYFDFLICYHRCIRTNQIAPTQ